MLTTGSPVRRRLNRSKSSDSFGGRRCQWLRLQQQPLEMIAEPGFARHLRAPYSSPSNPAVQKLEALIVVDAGRGQGSGDPVSRLLRETDKQTIFRCNLIIHASNILIPIAAGGE